ncbi:hypothetical protein ACFQY0_05260 [Haloferula chungangensis]|uniref:Tetratricopeptide repeat protein n=1 Tax=Haloferula chungangensis TaxID=1048331 RepID=A0ABW2L4F9_9BACT
MSSGLFRGFTRIRVDFPLNLQTFGAMKFRLLPTCLAVVSFSLAQAAEDRGQERVPGELIRQLGDERYPVREAATFELWSMGEKARPLLKQAIASGDPEVAVRARGVLRKIHLGILPDSPPEVVELVVKYDTVSPQARLVIVRRLKQLRAWRQVLRIHELERDPKTLELISGEIDGVAVEAARELLADDEPDFSGAKELLEMGRPEPAQLMALADFHRMAGSLENELRKAEKLDGEAGHLWRYVLLAAKGDLDGAAKEADAAGQEVIGARLRALDGDPLPWVKMVPVPPQQIPPDSLEAYRDAVVDLWDNRPIAGGLVASLVKESKNGGVDERLGALGLLYALGESGVATDSMAELVPVLAFFHYENNERVDDAFRSLGLDPAEPDFEAWAAKRFEVVINDPDNSEDELNALATLGWFLERREMDEMAMKIFSEPLAELARQDPEIFLDKTNELFASFSFNRVVWPVLDASAAFAGEDPAKLIMVRDNLFGEGVHVSPLWESLGLYDPKMDGRTKLRMTAELLGFAPDDSNSLEKWWEWGRVQMDKGAKDERREMMGLLLAISAVRSDAIRYLEITDLMHAREIEFSDLGELGETFRFAEYELSCLIAVGRWEEIVERRRLASARVPTDPIRRAYLAGALRKVGKEAEAALEEEKIERLVLGDVRAMRWIARAYTGCGDFERAGEWWWRVALETTGSTEEFSYAAEAVLAEAKEQGNWKLVASLGELQMLYHLMMGDRSDQPWTLLRSRIETEMARALSTIDDDREAAIEMLERCHNRGATDGSMADYFFPALRSVGLTEQHDRWFEETWKSYVDVLERFPGSHNTRNTAAWTAARANRRLDQAEKMITEALEAMPRQAAYLDTLGEIWFCRGDREKALKWSTKALLHEPGESTLVRQHERFRSGDFPLK